MSSITSPPRAAGSTNAVQYNQGGKFGADDAGLTYVPGSKLLTVGSTVSIGQNTITAGATRPDGSDDAGLILCGAPEPGDGSRGARIVAYGNEGFDPGALWLITGNTPTAVITVNRAIRFGSGMLSVADPNAFDCFQETGWQPKIAGTSGQSGQSYALQVGFAVKMGRVVIAEFAVALSVLGTIAGNVAIDGFPWASAYGFASCQCVFYGLTIALPEVRAQMAAGAQYAVLNAAPVGGSTQNIYPLIPANLSNGTDIRGCITYFAAA